MTAQQMVANVQALPPISPAALKLVALLDQPEGSNDDVVRVLKQDSVLTAKLLRACNSAAVALEEPVTSVDQAVLMLGYSQILQMVVALAFGSAMSVRLPGYEIEASELWRHSLLAASAGELIIAEGVDLPADPAMAFTIGLLHDIGKLVMSQFLDLTTQAAVRHLISEGFSSEEAEKRILGADHAEVGACLLGQWRLQAEIVEAVASHHHPALEPQPRLSTLAHLADCIAHLVGAAPGWEAYALRGSTRMVQVLRLDAAVIERLVISVRGAFDNADRFIALT